MATSGFTRLAPGTAATAASVASRLSGVGLAINDVPLASVEEKSLTRQHIPSQLAGTPKTVALNLAVGFEAVYSGQVGAEPYPTWATVAGWKVVNDVGTLTGPNTLTATGLGVTLSASTTIEVIAEVEVVDVELWNYTAGARLGANRYAINVYAVFTIQYSNDAVTWYNAANFTERYVDAESVDDATTNTVAGVTAPNQLKRVMIATLIRYTDSGGAITVNYVRMVVSCHSGRWPAVDPTYVARVRLRTARLSAQGFVHGILS